MDEFSKPSKKGSILAVACYVFAVALLITAFVSWRPATKISPDSLSRASLCREMNWLL